MAVLNHQRIRLILGLALAFGLGLIPAASLAQQASPLPSGTTGNYYIVQRGDTWAIIAWRNGLTVGQLKAANPTLVRPRSVLWVGDRLFIPARSSAATGQPATGSQGGYWYTVKPGDTWQTVARDSGASVLDLWHANPGQLYPNRWLYTGTRLWIPSTQQATATPVAATAPSIPPATATEAPMSLPTAAEAATIIAEPTVTPTVEPAATATVTPVAQTTPAATGGSATAGCPQQLADYGEPIATYLNSPGATTASLQEWLTRCGAIRPNLGSVITASIQSKAGSDVIVVIHDPEKDPSTAAGKILVYHNLANGYVLTGVADGLGRVDVLRVGDINKDGKPDIVWTDTTCTGDACTSTLFVDSWTGTLYQSWIQDHPATANGQYSFQTVPNASGLAILVRGVVSSGTGQQQVYTETYTSQNGSLYKLANKVYAQAACLTDRVLDANKALDSWGTDGFGPAIQDYQAAITDTTLAVCGLSSGDAATLRDFVRFRLVVASLGNGQATQAVTYASQIETSAIKGAADALMASYNDSHSLIQACRDTTTYAEEHPDAWQYMNTLGLGGTSFTAGDLCPLAK